MSFGGASTLVNFGLILGPVEFYSPQGRLVAEADSVLAGRATAPGATLELAGGAETITGMGGLATITGGLPLDPTQFGDLSRRSGRLAGAERRRHAAARLQPDRWGVDQPRAGVGLTLDDGAVAEVQGMVVFNAGSITLQSAGKATDLRILAKGATFSADASVELNGPASRILGATATTMLTNLGDITGAGFIGVNQPDPGQRRRAR